MSEDDEGDEVGEGADGEPGIEGPERDVGDERLAFLSEQTIYPPRPLSPPSRPSTPRELCTPDSD